MVQQDQMELHFPIRMEAADQLDEAALFASTLQVVA
jgi:hypothetical protein